MHTLQATAVFSLRVSEAWLQRLGRRSSNREAPSLQQACGSGIRCTVAVSGLTIAHDEVRVELCCRLGGSIEEAAAVLTPVSFGLCLQNLLLQSSECWRFLVSAMSRSAGTNLEPVNPKVISSPQTVSLHLSLSASGTSLDLDTPNSLPTETPKLRSGDDIRLITTLAVISASLMLLLGSGASASFGAAPRGFKLLELRYSMSEAGIKVWVLSLGCWV